MFFGPLCQRQRDQFWPVVHPHFKRVAAVCHDPVQHPDDSLSRVIASTSRLKSSTTLKVRNRLPQTRASCIKSMDQLWFNACGVASGAGLRTGSRCFPYDENSVSAGSKSDERVCGSRYCPACAAVGTTS